MSMIRERFARLQVVNLGAGMCTRAWRLNLPEGVKWFEVDRSDVLSAKWKVLTAAGAAFEVGKLSEQAFQHAL